MSASKHLAWLKKEIPTWLENRLIDPQSADQILAHYRDFQEKPPSHLLARALATIGSLLIGLGVILVFAYNWQDIPQLGKLLLAFLPLTIASALAIFTLARRRDSSTWSEGVSIAFILASAAAMGLVGQTLHITSSLSLFYFVWILSSLPILFAFQSRAAFVLLCILSIFCISVTGRHENSTIPLRFTILLYPLIGYYLWEKRHTVSRLSLLALSTALTWTYTPLAFSQIGFISPLLWISLCFAVCYLWDSRDSHSSLSESLTATLAKLGLTILSFILSFRDAWNLGTQQSQPHALGILAIVLVSATYLLLLYQRIRERRWHEIPWAIVPLFIASFYGLALFDSINPRDGAFFFNPFIALLGIIAIRAGYRDNSVGRLNHGLAILFLLITMRFFDSNLGMLVRGLVFIALGIAFLAVNFHFLKKRKDAAHA